MTSRELFSGLRRRLEGRPPRPLGALPDGVRRASVLLPLFEKEGAPHLLFLKRPEGEYPHAGQIAFPGGTREGAEAPLACALREAHEETGILPADVDVLGPLDEYDTVVTGFRVSPIVGVIPYPYAFKPDPFEVERLIEIPLARLLDPAIRRVQTFAREGVTRTIYYYDVGDVLVWGVTGGMLTPLLEFVRQIENQ